MNYLNSTSEIVHTHSWTMITDLHIENVYRCTDCDNRAIVYEYYDNKSRKSELVCKVLFNAGKTCNQRIVEK